MDDRVKLTPPGGGEQVTVNAAQVEAMKRKGWRVKTPKKPKPVKVTETTKPEGSTNAKP